MKTNQQKTFNQVYSDLIYEFNKQQLIAEQSQLRKDLFVISCTSVIALLIRSEKAD